MQRILCNAAMGFSIWPTGWPSVKSNGTDQLGEYVEKKPDKLFFL